MRRHDQLQKQQDLHIKKVGLNLVDGLAHDLHIYYCLDLNKNQCEVEFNPQGECAPWSDGGGVCGVVMTNVKWPRVGTVGR